MKKRMIQLICGVSVLAVLFLMAACRKEPLITVNNETDSTHNAWLDETFAEDSTGTDEEHTLPMVTVA